MKITIIGAAGFIGTNLTKALLKNPENSLRVVDNNIKYFTNLTDSELSRCEVLASTFDVNTDFDTLVRDQDIVYHLVSTTVPSTSNQHIPQELVANVVATSKLLEACVSEKVRRIVFMSSGGTVYGKDEQSPIIEESVTTPISSYGLQKITIEKLMYLYNYMYGLDYRVIRLANPYGPYQRPNGVLGAVTTFTYKALYDEPITVYGDGSVIRDFIFIDDAIAAIIKIAESDCDERVFNVGSGSGTSIAQLLDAISVSLHKILNVNYQASRPVDVPINFLNVNRFQHLFGPIVHVSLTEGIKKTALFLTENEK